MVGNAGVGSQTAFAKQRNLPLPYTDAGCSRLARPTGNPERFAMVETRIKPHHEQMAEQARRFEQTRRYRRNQVFGLLFIVAAILVWWLFHTNPKWIFPPGWWRP